MLKNNFLEMEAEMEAEREAWKKEMELLNEKTLNKLMQIAREYYEELEELDEEEEEMGEFKPDDGQTLTKRNELEEEDQKIKVDGDTGQAGMYAGLKQKIVKLSGLKEGGNKMENCEKEFSSAIRESVLKKEDLKIIKTLMDYNNRIVWLEKFTNLAIVEFTGWIKEDGSYYFKNKWGKEGNVFLLYENACYDSKD